MKPIPWRPSTATPITGPTHFGVANFPAACAAACLELMQGRTVGHALDLGCAVGRASFELARGGFAKVTGLDFSTRFFRLATRMQEEGYLRYAFREEGEICSFHEISLADFGLEDCRDRVDFFQADACNLPEKFTGYDLVLAANLIDRLYSPRNFPGRPSMSGSIRVASWSSPRPTPGTRPTPKKKNGWAATVMPVSRSGDWMG